MTKSTTMDWCTLCPPGGYLKLIDITYLVVDLLLLLAFVNMRMCDSNILGLAQGANTCCSSLSHLLYLGPSTVIQCYLATILYNYNVF